MNIAIVIWRGVPKVYSRKDPFFQNICGMFFQNFLSEIFLVISTPGSMIQLLVPEISTLDGFCDGIGYSSSWIKLVSILNQVDGLDTVEF